MSPQHKKPPGDSHVSLGEKSQKGKQRFGSAVHRVGTHSRAEHAAVEKGTPGVRRQSHKAPLTPPKKGGSDASVL